MQLCAVKRLTGWPCPGCGLSRAYGAARRGQFRQATAYHPLWLPVGVWLLHAGWRLAHSKEPPPLVSGGIGIALTATWLFRLRVVPLAGAGRRKS